MALELYNGQSANVTTAGSWGTWQDYERNTNELYPGTYLYWQLTPGGVGYKCMVELGWVATGNRSPNSVFTVLDNAVQVFQKTDIDMTQEVTTWGPANGYATNTYTGFSDLAGERAVVRFFSWTCLSTNVQAYLCLPSWDTTGLYTVADFFAFTHIVPTVSAAHIPLMGVG